VRGRKPNPTALKKLKGERNKDRINDNEPQIVGNLPRCPTQITGEARKEWRRVIKQLHACPYITTLERAALAIYCQAWAMFLKAKETVEKHGPLIITKKGNIVQNPALSVMNKSMEQLSKYGSKLGFDPSERSRIRVPKGKKDDGGFADLLD